jgi:hypothetical protein
LPSFGRRYCLFPPLPSSHVWNMWWAPLNTNERVDATCLYEPTTYAERGG